MILAGLVGCPEKKSSAPPPPDDRKLARDFQEIVGRIKLVKEEYRDAVKDGAIVDATEYEEAEMFAEQAALRFRKVRGDLDAGHAAIAARIEKDLGALMKLIAGKGSIADEEALVARILADVKKVNPSPIPPAIEGTRAAVVKADFAIEAEQLVGGYRVGIFLHGPRPIYLRTRHGTLEAKVPADGDTHYVGVTVREPRTKRALPGAGVEVQFSGGAAVTLHHVWDEFQQYGGNAKLGPGKLTVRISPPAYHRHGDMLGAFVKPTTVEFTLIVGEKGLVAQGDPPAPVAADYEIGDDVLQGLAEASWKKNVGPYRLGFIAEAPEPYWLWGEDDALNLNAVEARHTHHLEIFVVEKGSNRVVPSAHVVLTLLPKDGGEPIVATLHPLLSAFYHYGKTLTVPPGRYDVQVRVMPPAFGGLGPFIFTEAVQTTFEWEAQAR